MKNFTPVLAAVASAFSAFAFADIVSVFPVAIQKVEISQLCPKNALCILDGTSVKLSFTVPCAGALGPVSVRLIEDNNGGAKLYVSAVSFASSKSAVSRCSELPVETFSVSLPSTFIHAEDIVDLNQAQ